MKKTHIVEITAYSHEGKGIARLDKLVLFIEGALKGELVEVEINQKKKRYAFAEIIRIIERSPYRVERDPERTGGSNLAHASYDHQLEIKEEIITSALRLLPGIEEADRENIIKSYLAEGYRNKGGFRINFSQYGQARFGFYEEGSHNFRYSQESILYSKQVNDLLKKLADILSRKEKENPGLFSSLENLMIRESGKNDHLMLVFSTGGKKSGQKEKKALLSLEKKLREIVMKNFPQVSSLYLNNKDLLQGIEGYIPYLEDSIGHLTFRIWPETFFQVHKRQTLRLYEKVAEYLEIESGQAKVDLFIDAYGGIGTIGSFVAQGAKKVLSIDQYEGAKKEGTLAAKLNGIDNIEFLVGKVEDLLPKMAKEKADALILDPPRAGAKPEVLQAIGKMQIPRIVYVSCNPASLGRDLKILIEEYGYKLEKIVGVDMFPQTSHVECVTLMSRVK